MNVNISSDLTERTGYLFNGVAQPSNASSIPVIQNLYYDGGTSSWSSGFSSEGSIITLDTDASKVITGGNTSFQAISNTANLTVFRSCMAGLDDPNNIAEVNYATIDRQGHLKVDITGGNISGFSTSAKQDTIIGHLDGVEGKLDVLETSLTSMETKQDTQITHLSEIEGAVETLEGCVGSNKVNVNISSGNISGFATSANQASILTKNTEIDTVLDASLVKQTAIETLITSTNSKIDILDGVQDNALTKLTEIDSAVDVVNVILNSIKGDTTSIETAVEILDDIVLTEDTAHGTGNKGVMGLAVRKDTQASICGTDGDYAPLQLNATGALRVESSIYKTTLNRTTARDLATRGSHADWSVDTGTEANFISFYIDFEDGLDGGVAKTDIQVQYSQSQHYSNPIVVFQGTGVTIPQYGLNGTQYRRTQIELKNPARYVRIFNDNASNAISVARGIIIHGRE